jgi:putative peptidoglycan lipid II flippase
VVVAVSTSGPPATAGELGGTDTGTNDIVTDDLGMSVARSAAGMGAAAAVSRALGAGRMVVVAAVLGTTYLGNVFQASNSVSNVLFELLAAGALSAVLVPTFVDLLGRGERQRAEEVAGRLLGIALVGLGAVAVLGVAFAPAIADLLTTNVDDPQIAADQQELATFLLRFFIPQVVLYAIGAVTTAVLNARGRLAVTAAAPIGNSIVIVVSMVVFAIVAGPDPGLDLTLGEQLVLALGGTLGVAAFVAVPAVALWRSGFRLRLGFRRALRDIDVRRTLGLSGWAAVQHAGAGILLAAAIIVGGGVAGGVVAYQLAMVVFLAPYGVLAQPIHTAVLPRLAADASRGDHAAFGGAVRWALAAMGAVTLPMSAALVALAGPIMRVLAFGEAAEGDGPELLAAAMIGLGLGVLPYGAFLLLARASYALGDSRTPAIAALVTAIAGAAIMIASGSLDGSDRLVGIGAGHSAAFAAASIWLGARLRRVTGALGAPALLRPAALAAAVGVAAWALLEAWSPDGRIATVVALAVVGAAGAALYVAGLRLVGGLPGPAPRWPGASAVAR